MVLIRSLEFVGASEGAAVTLDVSFFVEVTTLSKSAVTPSCLETTGETAGETAGEMAGEMADALGQMSSSGGAGQPLSTPIKRLDRSSFMPANTHTKAICPSG